MTLPRPRIIPRKIPLWAFHLDAWIRGGRKGPRPSRAPKRTPAWFWLWRKFTLARAKGKGSKAWKQYMAAVDALPPAKRKTHVIALRAAIVHWARWGVAHNGQIGYTQGPQRDDFLHLPVGHLPMETDCSGDVTQCNWAGSGKAPGADPSGLGFRFVGWTGSILEHAYKHGRVFTNLAHGLPGDDIVIGPGNGWHVVKILEAGPNPVVSSHGDSTGPKRYNALFDPRIPKRVCQTLPT